VTTQLALFPYRGSGDLDIREIDPKR